MRSKKIARQPVAPVPVLTASAGLAVTGGLFITPVIYLYLERLQQYFNHQDTMV